MKIPLQLTLFLIFFTFFSTLLAAQSVEELDRRNGFQDIKLATSVENYEGLQFKKDVKDEIFPEAQLYVAKKGYYENIASLKIYDLEVKAYKGIVFQIRIVTEKDPNLYKGLKKIYGEPEYAYRAAETQWNATNVRLSYNSHSKRKMEMVYHSHIATQQLEEEKKQEVKEIADDF